MKKLKLQKIAALVALSFSVNTQAINQNTSDDMVKFVIHLPYHADKSENSSAQQHFVEGLKKLSSSAKVLDSLSIIDNMLLVQTTEQVLTQLSNAELDFSYTRASFPQTSNQNASQHLLQASTLSSSSEELSALSEDAGAGVKVAIVGTGVDYTHAALGGSGSIDDYNLALQNATSAYDGFPTTVVTDGQDFVSEFGFGFDPNPIDSNVQTPAYPTGQGTAMAGVIHALAPKAEIVAVKTSNVVDKGRGIVTSNQADLFTLAQAFEWLIDANGDGLPGDKRADIVVLESTGSSSGIFQPTHGGDYFTAYQRYLEILSANDVLVVTDTGDQPLNGTKYTLSHTAAVPDVIAVNNVDKIGEAYSPGLKTAQGPVRGKNRLVKPDIAINSNVMAPVAGSGTESAEVSDVVYGAARVAAYAASIKSDKPELSASQIKSILVSTSDRGVFSTDTGQPPHLTSIGHGVPHADNARNAFVSSYDPLTMQPGINFGTHESAGVLVIDREIRLTNHSDSKVVFDLSLDLSSLSQEFIAATEFLIQDKVEIPAGNSINLPFSLKVDTAALPNAPMESREEFTLENWEKYLQAGFIIAESENHPTLSIGWTVSVTPSVRLVKDFSTFTEAYSGGPSETQFSNGVYHLHQEFKNNSTTSTTFAVLPTVSHRTNFPSRLDGVNGNTLQTLSAGLSKENACNSGEKFMIAATFLEPINVPVANYLDRGEEVLYIEGYPESTVLNNGWDTSYFDSVTPDFQRAFTIRFMMGTDGKPTAYYVDFKKAFDRDNPAGRYTESQLPVFFSPDSKNILAQFCTDELTHRSFPESGFDQNLGIMASTDRSTLIEPGEPIELFNPRFSGKVVEETYTDWFGNIVTELRYKGVAVGFSPVEQDVSTVDTYASIVELAPGSSARLHAVSDGFCGELCGNGFTLMALNKNLSLWSPIGLNDDASITAYVKQGQQIEISEADAVEGAIIGKIELDSSGFFATGPGAQYSDVKIELVRAVQDNAVRVEPNGDVVVVNPASLDFEKNRELTIVVATREGTFATQSTEVVIQIQNANDNAPKLIAELPNQTLQEGDNVDIDVSGLFVDEDGDLLTLTVSNLPAGITFNSSTGLISGAPVESGQYSSVIVATDGVFESQAQVNWDIQEKAKEKSSSGSFGFISTLLLAGLALVSRKQKGIPGVEKA